MATYKYGYKILGPNRMAIMGAGSWPEVGQWTDRIEDPTMCHKGWHIIPSKTHIKRWWWGSTPAELYIVEYREEDVGQRAADKIVVKRARLVEKIDLPEPPFDPKVWLGEFEKIDRDAVRKSRSRRIKDAYSFLDDLLHERVKMDRTRLREVTSELYKYDSNLNLRIWRIPRRTDERELLFKRKDLAVNILFLLGDIKRSQMGSQVDLRIVPDLPPTRVVREKKYNVVVTVEAENAEDAVAFVKSYNPTARLR